MRIIGRREGCAALGAIVATPANTSNIGPP